MRKKVCMAVMVITACALSACEGQSSATENVTETSIVSNVENNKETVAGKGTENIKINESKSGQTTTSQQQTTRIKKESYYELDNILNEINTDIHPGTAGNSLRCIRAAAHLLNWGVGTTMTTDEIKEETVVWLSDKDSTGKQIFSEKLSSVYASYKRLLEPDAEKLLDDAGCSDAPYPWSDSPVETIEAIIEAVK